MLELNKLESKLDTALEKETKESLISWLFSLREYHEIKQYYDNTIAQEKMQTYLKCLQIIDSLKHPEQVAAAYKYVGLFMKKYYDYDAYDELEDKLMKKEFELILGYNRTEPSFSPKY
jgi:hypothetical protein